MNRTVQQASNEVKTQLTPHASHEQNAARIIRVGCVASKSMHLIIAILVAALSATNSQAQDLEKGFANPPQAAKPSAYWLWLNGYANLDYMEHELRAFAEHGIGGLCIFDMGARGDAPEAPLPSQGSASLRILSAVYR